MENFNSPWFTNSVGLLVPAEVEVLLVKLIEDMLLCDWSVLLSISQVLVLQKSSDTLGFFTKRPWILNPLDGSSTATISGGLLQHPKQPLYCCKTTKQKMPVRRLWLELQKTCGNRFLELREMQELRNLVWKTHCSHNHRFHREIKRWVYYRTNKQLCRERDTGEFSYPLQIMKESFFDNLNREVLILRAI